MTSGPAPLETAATICARHGNDPALLIEVLHDVQEALGYVPEACLPEIAAHRVDQVKIAQDAKKLGIKVIRQRRRQRKPRPWQAHRYHAHPPGFAAREDLPNLCQ